MTNRGRVQILHLALIAGVCAVWLAFGALFSLGSAPFLPHGSPPVIAASLAAGALVPILLGWFWARPRIPYRRGSVSVEAFWQDAEAGMRALLAWVLWEGGAMIGAVGTVLTGSLVTAASGLVGLALLLLHGPHYLESRGR